MEVDAVEEAREFSGRLLIRMPRYLHREIAEIAREQGVSINQFVCLAAAAAVGVVRRESDAAAARGGDG